MLALCGHLEYRNGLACLFRDFFGRGVVLLRCRLGRGGHTLFGSTIHHEVPAYEYDIVASLKNETLRERIWFPIQRYTIEKNLPFTGCNVSSRTMNLMIFP